MLMMKMVFMIINFHFTNCLAKTHVKIDLFRERLPLEEKLESFKKIMYQLNISLIRMLKMVNFFGTNLM